jgi:hypothetical protein
MELMEENGGRNESTPLTQPPNSQSPRPPAPRPRVPSGAVRLDSRPGVPCVSAIDYYHFRSLYSLLWEYTHRRLRKQYKPRMRHAEREREEREEGGAVAHALD